MVTECVTPENKQSSQKYHPMRKIQHLFTALVVITLAACNGVRKDLPLELKEGWKFTRGDNPSWISAEFNDSSWAPVDPHVIWEKQGFKDHNGFGWYRIRFTLPGNMKENAPFGDSVKIVLGKIDDCDQVFLNGALIGENGRTFHSGKTADDSFREVKYIWNQPRRYVLASNDAHIRWDKENVIAVRCFDHGGAGGMYSGPFNIEMTGLGDYLSVDCVSSPFVMGDCNAVSKKIIIRNISDKLEFKGDLQIKVYNDKGYELYSDRAGALLTPGLIMGKIVNFESNHNEPAFLTVAFTESGTGATLAERVEIPYLLTPPVRPEPRINGASVFGVRPYSPFFFKVAASGDAPLIYKARSLPEGLSIDTLTGIITGMLKKKGEFLVELTVANPIGTCQRNLRIVVGELISLTPPMGWNSWNCWGLSVSDAKVRQSAEAMKNSGLIDHGWTYVNIDDGWEDTRDKDGNILPNRKFPDMRGLSHHVHSLGLKIGIYSSPGPKTCGGYEGSYQYEEKDAISYANWGIDYLKYDWCSYYSIAPDPTPEQMRQPYREMRHAIRKVNRDIHYSLCQYGMGNVWEWGAEVDGNSWRTTGDIEDTWESMAGIGFAQDKCSPYASPGRWNDPDMLVVGWVGWGPSLHHTRLTPNEQYTHITLWSLLASPLLIGCDLEQLDPFTLNLLTNDEVIAVNQDPCGKQASLISKGDGYQIWAKEMDDGSVAAGLFNTGEKVLHVPVDMNDLYLKGKWSLRDLWSQEDLGYVRNHFEMKVYPHGARMVLLKKG